jgi:hypothetical protein
MAQLFRFHRIFFSVAIAVSATSVFATFVEVKDPSNAQVSSIDFGVIRGSSPYHTSTQYLEITHTGASFRKIFIYTDNATTFGISEPGLVNLSGQVPIPMVFHNFLSEPPAQSVSFSASTAAEWPAVLDQSNPDFAILKESAALVTPGDRNLSYVYLGIQLPLNTKMTGAYNTNIVIEDWSDAEEVDGPVIVYGTPESLIIMPNEPVGFLLTMEEYSGLETYGVRYRLEGDSEEYEESVGSTPQQEGSIYKGNVELDPSFRLLSGKVLNYYFVAKDIYINVTETSPHRMNLVSNSALASVPFSSAGGSFSVAIGDPRRRGVEVTFPSGSLRSGGTLTVGVKDPSSFPPLNGNAAVRVFQIGPEDPGLLRPALVSLPYLDIDDALGAEDTTSSKESDLRLYWHDGFGWRYVGGKVDPEGNRIQASVSRFGVFGIFPGGGNLTADTLRPKERIITFNGGNDELIFGTTIEDGPFDIEIFDIRSNVVRKLHNINFWDGRDEGGNRVESGTYVYRFEGQGMTLTGMVAVAR